MLDMNQKLARFMCQENATWEHANCHATGLCLVLKYAGMFCNKRISFKCEKLSNHAMLINCMTYGEKVKATARSIQFWHQIVACMFITPVVKCSTLIRLYEQLNKCQTHPMKDFLIDLKGLFGIW